MNKRKRQELSTPHQESNSGADIVAEVSRNELANDGVRQTNDIHQTRTFLASLACEQCRSKKTKCDEDRPKCGQCKASHIECVYGEKRFTKKDQSLNAAVNAIRRLETKIEDLTAAFNEDRQERRAISSLPEAIAPKSFQDHQSTQKGLSKTSSKPPNSQIQPRTPVLVNFETGPQELSSRMQLRPTPISFSQHATIQWASIRLGLPEYLQRRTQRMGPELVIEQEIARSPLYTTISSFPKSAGENWLNDLPVQVVKALSDLYFLTFNRISPILDKDFFDQDTLPHATKTSFDDSVETCIVLNVLALGCLALQAYEEGDFELPSSIPMMANMSGFGALRKIGRYYVRPAWARVAREIHYGLSFFNEARKKLAFLSTNTSLQTCQNLLLSALYSAQLIRPMDSWTYINRACVTCMLVVKLRCRRTFATWEDDMISRVFWTALMTETILVQELDLPPSGLVQYEDDVQLPKFLKCSRLPSGTPTSRVDDGIDADESYFQYHFLAQVAHRIILTRIRNSIYFIAEAEDFPPQAVVAELYHQLNQWREALPPIIQFQQDIALHNEAQRAASPAHAVADAILRSRYRIAKFHIGRPFLCKVLQHPDMANERDLEACRSAFEAAMWWPAVQGICQSMKSFAPLNFAFACQFFGQQVLHHAFATHRIPALQSLVPSDWNAWSVETTQLLTYCAVLSPAISSDLNILEDLEQEVEACQRHR